MLEQGKNMRSPPPEKKGAAEIKCGELTTTSIPHHPVPLQGTEAEKLEVKLSPGTREGEGEGVSKIWFYFSLAYSDR